MVHSLIWQMGLNLICCLFATLLADSLQEAGMESKGYNTHSFRIGAAMMAKDKGI